MSQCERGVTHTHTGMEIRDWQTSFCKMGIMEMMREKKSEGEITIKKPINQM